MVMCAHGAGGIQGCTATRVPESLKDSQVYVNLPGASQVGAAEQARKSV